MRVGDVVDRLVALVDVAPVDVDDDEHRSLGRLQEVRERAVGQPFSIVFQKKKPLFKPVVPAGFRPMSWYVVIVFTSIFFLSPLNSGRRSK